MIPARALLTHIPLGCWRGRLVCSDLTGSAPHFAALMRATAACGLQPFLRRLEVAERNQEREVVHDLEHAADHER